MIPKKIWFYWGGLNMSYMRYMTLYSFCKYNPEWEVNLILNESFKDKTWQTEEKIDSTSGIDYLEKCKELKINIRNDHEKIDFFKDKEISHVHIKDILNWYLLSNEGGVVSDMDILFFKSLNPVIDALNNKSVDVALVEFEGYPKKGYIPVSFMVATPKTKLMNDAYEKAIKNYDPEKYESCGTPSLPYSSLKELTQNYRESKIAKLSSYLVFPTVAFEFGMGLQQLFIENVFNLFESQTIGIHWYAGSPLASGFNDAINEYTYRNYNNTMTFCLKKILKENN